MTTKDVAFLLISFFELVVKLNCPQASHCLVIALIYHIVRCVVVVNCILDDVLISSKWRIHLNVTEELRLGDTKCWMEFRYILS